MHNATTKQRLSALRRKLGIFTGWQPRWVKERSKRLARHAPPPGLAMRLEPPALERTDAAPTELVAAPPAGTPDAAEWNPVTSVASPPATTELVVAGAGTGTPWPRPAPADIAPAPARSVGRARSRNVAVALALAVVLAGIFILTRRAPGPGDSAPAAAAGLERASGRDGVVPTAAPSEPQPVDAPAAATVEVRRGDTLWHLAAVHLGDPMRWPELHAANAPQIHDPDLIFPGQQLRVPGSARL